MKKLLFIDNSVGDHYDASKPFQPLHFPMPVDRVDLYAGDPRPCLDEYSHIISTGCTRSICSPEPWMEKLESLLAEAVERNIDLLTICFSHQMLAKVIAGDSFVRRRAEPELGWVKQTVLCDDELLGVKGTVLWGFVSHFDEVCPELPLEKAVILLRSESCGVEAFRVNGKNAWGIQGHFEETIESGLQMLKSQTAEDGSLARYIQNGSSPKDSGIWPDLLQRFFSLN